MTCCGPSCAAPPLDNKFKHHGMALPADRKCRDVFCLLFFIIFCCATLVIGGIGIHYGKPERLVYGTDYLGRTCGVDSPVQNMRYTAYPRTNEDFVINVFKSDPLHFKFYGVCVSSCPGLLDVVCNYDIINASSAASLYTQSVLLSCMTEPSYSPPAGVSCAHVSNNCWVTPQVTLPTFFRCIPAYNVTVVSSSSCMFPTTVRLASDPACILAQNVAQTTVQKPAHPSMLFDQMNTARQLWGRWFGDLNRAWWVILVCSAGLAVLLSFVFVLAMKYFTGCMVWTTVVLVVLGLAGLDIWFYFKGGVLHFAQLPPALQADINAIPKINTAAVTQYVSYIVPAPFELTAQQQAQAYSILAYIFSAITIIVFVIVLALRRSISTATKVIKIGADALRNLPSLICFPLLTVTALAAFLVWWIFVAASLATSGYVTVGDLTADAEQGLAYLRDNAATYNATAASIAALANAPSLNATISTYTEINAVPYLLIVHFFGLLWTMQFILGISTLTIAGAVCAWYFSRNDTNSAELAPYVYPKERFMLCRSLGRTLRYYLGSAAFGSLLIALLQFIRAICLYIQRRMAKGNASQALQFLVCCVQCCLKCVQAMIEVVTRNAWIVVALKGTSFCSGGREAFRIIVENATVLLFVNIISELIMFVAKVGIALACGWASYVLMDHVAAFQAGGSSPITSSWLVVLVTIFFAYAVTGAFMSVLDLTIDTALVCYVTDIDETAQRTGRRVSSHVPSTWLASFSSPTDKPQPETSASVAPAARTSKAASADSRATAPAGAATQQATGRSIVVSASQAPRL